MFIELFMPAFRGLPKEVLKFDLNDVRDMQVWRALVKAWSLSVGDWPEDFASETGRYLNVCLYCGREFRGHKRRVTCKICRVAANPKDVLARKIEAEGDV